jgi:hypothetical protein
VKPGVRPKILIAATSRWFPTARLGTALARAGCQVEAICPPRHPLEKVGAVGRRYPYRGLLPLHSLDQAIAQAEPDMIVPGDDLATLHLHQLHAREARRGSAGSWLAELIERSLGSPQSFPVVYSRTAFMELAREAGVRAPRTEVIANLGALKHWLARTGFPTILKTDGTSGGAGVRVVHTLEEAEEAFQTLQAPPVLPRAIKRALVDQDKTLLWPWLLRRRATVNAQEHVPGREATSALACWDGELLASLHFEVLNKREAAGPSSVLRLIENDDMSSAAAILVRRLNLSGLHGFDFMLEAQSGQAHLIEINPRATQVGHLTLGAGRDLPAALLAALSGAAPEPSLKLTEKDTIALFPQEWMRDPASPYLQTGYHDVPWDEPELLRACAAQRPQQAALDFPQLHLRGLSEARLRRL